MSETLKSQPTKSSEPPSRGSSGTQLLDKALNIVELVANTTQRMSAQTIAAETRHPKPTVYRILAALVRRGMLTLDERDQTYELGLRFADMTASLRASHRFLMLIEQDLMSLSARTGETVTVGIAERDSVRIISRYRIGFEVESGATRGSKRPYHASGIGKAALAWLPESELPHYLKRIQFQPFTPQTLLTPEALRTELKLIRARGYAIDDEEIIENVRCVARPLLTREGQLVATLSVSAPALRMSPQRMRQLADALGLIAEQFTQRATTLRDRQRPSDSSITCLHEGGLFHPIAIGQSEENLLVLDALAPAIHLFQPDGLLFRTHTLPKPPSAAAISSAGRNVLVWDGRASEWHEGTTVPIDAPTTEILSIAFDGDRLIAVTAGNDPALWDLDARQRLGSLQSIPVALACAGHQACVADRNGDLAIYSLDTGALIDAIPGERGATHVDCLAFDRDAIYSLRSDEGYLKRLERISHHQTYMALPERHVTAIGLLKGGLYLAGSNMQAAGETTRDIPGSLYLTKSVAPS